MDRRTGKTTRAIDKAVQTLFEKEELLLYRKIDRIRPKDLYISPIAPDANDHNMAQEFFVARLMKRLDSEHVGRFKAEFKGNYLHITVDER